jgi:nucleotide-binding universal stress UspA family protein
MTTILVGTDTSAAADVAIEDAARLARARGGELVILYVRPEGDVRAIVDPARPADPEAYLTRLSTRFPGVPTRTRIEFAAEEDADTIVLGNRGTHGSRWRVRDSVPNIVLRHSPCSVFIVDTRKAQ